MAGFYRLIAYSVPSMVVANASGALVSAAATATASAAPALLLLTVGWCLAGHEVCCCFRRCRCHGGGCWEPRSSFRIPSAAAWPPFPPPPRLPPCSSPQSLLFLMITNGFSIVRGSIPVYLIWVYW